MSERFLFFGCWNSINCKKKDDSLHRDIILEYINKYEGQVENIFIAGDNWYATTFLQYVDKINIKLYLKDILISGYYKLYELSNKIIHIAVGNHDEDIGEEDKDEDEKKKELKKNCMINTQRHYIRKIIDHISDQKKDISFGVRERNYEKSLGELNSFKNKDKVQPTTLESLKTLETLNYIGVEKDKKINLYVKEIGVIVDNNKYIMIVINTNYFDLEKKAVDEYLDKINIIIEKQIDSRIGKHLFVMGHIPLFTYKNKEGKLPISITAIDSDIINRFYDILVHNNCIYLCADTHNFSIMKIKKNGKCLIQITSGTGGADPDEIDENYKQSDIKYNADDYNISYVSVNSFGYSSVNIDNTNNITISYNNVIKINNEPGNIYTYDITDDLKLLNDDTLQRSDDEIKDITNIIKEVNDGKYKEPICDLITKKDIDIIINEMIVKDKENKVSCYEKVKIDKKQIKKKLK